MSFKSLALRRFLSFGDAQSEIELHNLNVIIGPNGSGKSNLIEAFVLLKSAPTDLLTPIRDGGGVRDWLWKGGDASSNTACLSVTVSHPEWRKNVRYILMFSEVGQRFEIVDERIEDEKPQKGYSEPYFYYRFQDGHPILNVKEERRELQREDIDLTASILAQRKDPISYPEVTFLGREFSRVRTYREWSIGRYTPPRLPQKADLPNEYLSQDAGNLGLVLNRLKREPGVKREILGALNELYEGIEDFDVQVEGGTVQVFLYENGVAIPATRLSDGTLRYLCLLAILCHPDPPPLVCIEEPELGLHPDVLPFLAGLLKKAAERGQLIVTTHSDILIDALSDQPEAVLVAEKGASGTTLTRLSHNELSHWLEQYRLGELWTRGEIGGTRW